MNAKISEIQNILNDIEAHILPMNGGAYDLYFDGDMWDCNAVQVTDEYDLPDDDEIIEAFEAGQKIWYADDDYEGEYVIGKTAAIEWMSDSIDQALSTELDNLKMEQSWLDGIEDTQVAVTSINPQQSGWGIVTVADSHSEAFNEAQTLIGNSTNIYTDTDRKNLHVISAQVAYEQFEVNPEAIRQHYIEYTHRFDLRNVMTPAEIEREFGLAEGTVRQAVNRNSIAHRRPDERTILIHRKDAEARWQQ